MAWVCALGEWHLDYFPNHSFNLLGWLYDIGWSFLQHLNLFIHSLSNSVRSQPLAINFKVFFCSRIIESFALCRLGLILFFEFIVTFYFVYPHIKYTRDMGDTWSPSKQRKEFVFSGRTVFFTFLLSMLVIKSSYNRSISFYISRTSFRLF